ncbi:MAG: hypothetical protein ABI682_08505 [Acidobacteriota bacterium]
MTGSYVGYGFLLLGSVVMLVLVNVPGAEKSFTPKIYLLLGSSALSNAIGLYFGNRRELFLNNGLSDLKLLCIIGSFTFAFLAFVRFAARRRGFLPAQPSQGPDHPSHS